MAKMRKRVREIGLVKERQALDISAKEFWRDSLAQDLIKQLVEIGWELAKSAKTMTEKKCIPKGDRFQVVQE